LWIIDEEDADRIDDAESRPLTSSGLVS